MLYPKDIARSFAELFWRSSQWLWWLVTILAAGAALFVEHIWPHTQISDQLWLDVVIVGALSSTFVAYHRLRVERDALGGEVIPAIHRARLHERLEVLRGNIEAEEQCDYGEEPDVRERNLASFRAHYAELAAALEAWDKAIDSVNVSREQAREAVESGMSEKGLNDGSYRRSNLLEVLKGGLSELAEDDALGTYELPWGYQQPYPPDADMDGGITLSERLVSRIPNLPLESQEERMKPFQVQVERFFAELVASDPTLSLRDTSRRVRELKGALLLDLEEWLTVESLRAKQDCDICRKNLGLDRAVS